MTPKKKWAKATGIEAGDRVLCLDTEAVRAWRASKGFTNHDGGEWAPRYYGRVEEVFWEATEPQEKAVTDEALLVAWDSTGGMGRITPFWMVIKDEA